MGTTYQCDGCGKENLDPRSIPSCLHWTQKTRTDGKYSANIVLCPECQTDFENKLKVKPEFKLRIDKKK